MILIKYVQKKDFEYDIQGLIRSFFPGEDMATDQPVNADLVLKTDIGEKEIHIQLEQDGSILERENASICKDDRKAVKNKLKRMVYDILQRYTKKELLWGTLSGIRPTKITTELLQAGKDAEWIKKHLKEEYYLSDEKTDLSLRISQNEIRILQSVEYERGYSVYIGIPFCPSTCSYCSFTSYPLGVYRDKVDAYLDALIKEIEFAAQAFQNRILNTIYIGGGTPTTLEPPQLDRLLGKIRETFDLSHLQEFTVEAGRPDSITADKLKVMAGHRVSRMSINPQTMNEKTLKIIGRKHTVEQIKQAFYLARSQGFDNINMDFIVGLPQETIEDVAYSMREAQELAPDSMTIHSLAVKRAAKLNTSKEEFAGYSYQNDNRIMKLTEKYAEEMGMEPYYLYRQKNMAGNMENVGYAVSGKAGLYNILIMEEKQTIVALGAGAASKMVFPAAECSDGSYPQGKRIQRIENVKDVKCYIDRVEEMIERKAAFLEKYKEVF